MLGGHSALFIIDPRNMRSEWINHPEGVKGLEKVKKFLMNRRSAVSSLKIQEGEIVEVEDLTESVLCSKTLNSMVDQWVKTWFDHTVDEINLDELYLKGNVETALVTPQCLLSELRDCRVGCDQMERKANTGEFCSQHHCYFGH